MSNYVEVGYVETDYIEGGAVDISTAMKKKINFIVDNQNLSDIDLNSLLLAQVGENYKNEISIIFGADLKIAEKKAELFAISKVAGGISKEVVDLINEKITDINAQIEIVSSRVEEVANSIPTVSTIVNSISSNNTLISTIANAVIGKMSVDIVAANGDVITSDLIYDDTKHSYVLDYDTSLLDGTNYTIELKIGQ